MGDVGLPALVGLVGLEAFPAGAGAFVGLWGDEAAAVQDAPDGGDARNVVDVGVAVQVFGDGGCAGVVAGFGQGFAEPDDRFFDVGVDGVGVGVGPSGAGFEGGCSVGFVAFNQLVDPVAG